MLMLLRVFAADQQLESSMWKREGNDCGDSVQKKEACGDLLSGCYTPLRDYPTPFGAERPLHGVEQPLIDQRPNLGIILQSLDCSTTLSLVR